MFDVGDGRGEETRLLLNCKKSSGIANELWLFFVRDRVTKDEIWMLNRLH